jgi:hypothetical protein
VRNSLTECVNCDQHGTCANTAIIEHMRKGAQRVGMKVKDKRGSTAKVMEKWMSDIGDG